MSIFLWILQIVLALLFAFSGLNKLLKGSDSLDHTKASVSDLLKYSVQLVSYFLGRSTYSQF